MNNKTIYVAMFDAVLVVWEDDGWTAREALTEQSCQAVVVDPHVPGRAYCGTEDEGVWRTDDGGAMWQGVGGLMRDGNVTSLAVSPTDHHGDGSVLYAGTEPSAVFRSSDGGAEWEALAALDTLPSSPSWSFPPRPDTHHARWITIDPLVPGRLFVAVEAGALVRSDDGGRHWVDRVPGGPIDTHTLVADPLRRDRLYSAAGDGYFESEDGGRTWRQVHDGLRHRYAWSCLLDAGGTGAVVISAASGAMTAHPIRNAESWIYRKTGGGPWEPIRSGLPDPRGTTISSLAADPMEPGVAYAANNHGVFRSTDGGATWQSLDIAWPERFRQQRVMGLAVGD